MSEVKIALQKSRLEFIVKVSEEFSDGVPNLRIQDVLTKIKLLEAHWEKFEKTYERLAETKSENILTNDYFTKAWYSIAVDNYSTAIANLLTLKDDLMNDQTLAGSQLADTSAINSNTSSRAYLPKITLKSLSGDYIEWQSFADLFSSLVGNSHELTNVEKMHYLRSTLEGDAAQLIASLPNSGDSFPIAWDSLVSRYENKRILITSQLQKLLSHPTVSTQPAKTLQVQLNSTNEAVSALRALGAPVYHWNMLLVHLLVRNLDRQPRESWELHLGSSSDYPTFEQPKTLLTGRARALENIELNKTNSTTSVSSKTSNTKSTVSRSTQQSVRVHSTTTGESS